MAKWSDTKRAGWAAPRHTLELSERRCIGCRFRLPQVLVDDDPTIELHPCCDEVATPIHFQLGVPHLRYDR